MPSKSSKGLGKAFLIATKRNGKVQRKTRNKNSNLTPKKKRR